MTDEEYGTNVNCTNCGESITLSVKKGLTVKDHIMATTEKCNNCECILNYKHYF